MRRCHFIVILLFTHSIALAATGWKVKDNGKEVELLTPWGTKQIIGDLAPNGMPHYRIEIPLDQLKPPAEATTPTTKTEDSAANDDWEEWEEETETVVDAGENRTPAAAAAVPAPPPKVVVEYDDSDRFVVEANRLYNRGKFYDATNVVEELLRKKPDHVRGWIMKGSLMHVQGHKDLAKTSYQQALKLDPENQEVKKLVEKYK